MNRAIRDRRRNPWPCIEIRATLLPEPSHYLAQASAGRHVGVSTHHPRETTMKTALAGAALALAAALDAQTPARQPGRDMGGGTCSANPYNCADTPNPIPAPNTVWLEEMTWMDVRDALKAGKTTIIVPTGRLEPNGPWIALGKHNYVLHQNCEAIARKMGNALCAPILKFVPEGDIEPKTSHMVSPLSLIHI